MGSKLNSRTRNAATGAKIFRGLLILLAVILVLLLVIAGNTIRREAYVYVASPDDLLREIRNGYYPDAVMDMHDNIALGETPAKNSDYSIPYAILEYYESASLYHGYKGVDVSTDPERGTAVNETLERCKTVMEDARGRMGELEFFAAEIDAVFQPD